MSRHARAALLALAVSLALAPTAGARGGPAARAAVVGGQTAPPGRYPWMVALSVGCGGTLIAPDRVLTAGHCVEGLRVSSLRIYVGARLRRAGTYRYDGIAVRATDVATHPGYRSLAGGGATDDVAVVRLERPLSGVPTVRLASPAEPGLAGAGSAATVVGWGITRTDLRGAPLARGLRRGALRVLPDRSCARAYGSDGSFRRAMMLCARSRSPLRRPNTSPCLGDSGGPLLGRGDVQIGIVSFGISCGTLREPTVFTRLAALRGFIDLPTPVWSPQPLDRPRVEGDARPGEVVTCAAPPWRNTVTRTRYRWGIDGILVATAERVRVTGAAAGKVLQCRAVAENAGGTTPSPVSAPVRVGR